MLGFAVCLALLIPATAACLGHLLPTLATILRGTDVPRLAESMHTFAVLIPAHDEEAALPAALRSLTEQDYPADRFRVYVVADNCTDRTAEVARTAGVTCFVRADSERRGKGHALAFGLERVLKDAPDVVVILDADCTLNREALRELDAAFAAGAEVAQAAVRSRNADEGPTGYVAAVGAAFDEAVAVGRHRLGLSVPLRGTGMAFRRDVLKRVPWEAFGPVEDAEYAGKLWRAGVRVRHSGAVVSCAAPAAVDELCRQRRRWRAAAGFLSSKPLVLAELLVAATACGITGELAWWAAALVLLTTAIYLRAVAAVGFTRRRLGLLLRSPALVTRLGWLTLTGLVRPSADTWDRTPRPTERRAA